MIQRASYLFTELQQDEAQIIVPSVAVAEYITPIKRQDERTRTIAAISKRFIIAPFDAKCAAIAAMLFSEGKSSREMGNPNARAVLKADVHIVATARIYGAREFYSNDADCRNLAAKAGMTPSDLPNVAPHLFADGDKP